MIVTIVVLAVVFGLGWLAYRALRRVARRGKEMTVLARDGLATEGLVTRVEKIRLNRAGEQQFFATYEFSDTGGSTHHRRLELLTSEIENYTEGQEIDIVYLPGQPSINATKDSVNQVRRSLGLAAL